MDHARRGHAPVTDHGIGRKRGGRLHAAGEGHAIRLDSARDGPGAISDDELVARRIQLEHIERLRSSDLDPAALADRVMNQPVMRAEYVALFTDDLAGTGHVRPPLGYEICV